MASDGGEDKKIKCGCFWDLKDVVTTVGPHPEEKGHFNSEEKTEG